MQVLFLFFSIFFYRPGVPPFCTCSATYPLSLQEIRFPFLQTLFYHNLQSLFLILNQHAVMDAAEFSIQGPGNLFYGLKPDLSGSGTNTFCPD